MVRLVFRPSTDPGNCPPAQTRTESTQARQPSPSRKASPERRCVYSTPQAGTTEVAPALPRAPRPKPQHQARGDRRVGATRLGPVPSTRSLSAATACSVTPPAGLFHPAAGPGVHDLSGVHPPGRSPGLRSLSDRATNPTKCSTLRQPVRVTAAPCLPGVSPVHSGSRPAPVSRATLLASRSSSLPREASTSLSRRGTRHRPTSRSNCESATSARAEARPSAARRQPRASRRHRWR